MSNNPPVYTENVQLEVRNKVLEKQIAQIHKNENILQNIDIDLNTVRRQSEIVTDSALRKTNHLFILKTVLTFVGISFIPIILKSQNLIDHIQFLSSLGIILIVLLIILLFNFKSIIIRSGNRFNVRNFEQPEILGKNVSNNRLPRKCQPKVKKSEALIEFEKRQSVLKTIEDRYKFLPRRDDRLSKQINEIDNLQSVLIDEYKRLDNNPDLTTNSILAKAEQLQKRKGEFLFT